MFPNFYLFAGIEIFKLAINECGKIKVSSACVQLFNSLNTESLS